VKGPALFTGAFLAILILSAVGSVAAQPNVQSIPMVSANTTGTSTNWSGYAVSGADGSVTFVGGSWTVPSVTCPAKGSTYSAFWVGIDGLTSKTVEQTGTTSDCSGGVAHYSAWYEFYPNPSHKVSSITIHPGDVINANVTFSNGVFTVQIQDYTSGGYVLKTGTVAGAKENSGEFIAEAPTVCSLTGCHLAKLSNFGTVAFGSDYTGVSATCSLVVNGVSGALGSFGSSVVSIKMATGQGVVKALPSALSLDGTSFTIQWLASGS
jgi:Peptidase A4 family